MAKKIISYVQTLGKKRYALVAVVVILGVGAVISIVNNNHDKLVPGIYLIGPARNIKLFTNYTYQLEVVSPKTYDNATVAVLSGPAHFIKIQRHVDLQANKPWVSSDMTLAFANTQYISTQGIQTGVNVPQKPGSLRYNNLFSKAFSISLAPVGQQPASARSVNAPAPKIGNSKLPK